MIYLFVGLGGAVGSLLRFALSYLTGFGGGMPFGTLAVNLSGSFLLGWFTARYIAPGKVHPYFSAAFATGMIGSYTTFSTFCLETIDLLKDGRIISSFLYYAISLAGGLILTKLGVNAGESARAARSGGRAT